MRFTSDLPDLGLELAAVSPAELAKQFAAAYAKRDRAEFLRIGQRLVREVAISFRGGRMQSLQSELYSEGILALIQQFDKTTRPIEHPFWYFRTAVRRAILAWARQQKIIRRKGAKHANVVLDADVSSADDFDSTLVESTAVAPENDDDFTNAIYKAAADHTDRRILVGLQAGNLPTHIADALRLDQSAVEQRIAAMRERVAAVRDPAAGFKLAASIACAASAPIDADVGGQRDDSPTQLRALGYSYPAIAKRLGKPYLEIFWACNPGKRIGYGRNPARQRKRNARAARV